MKRNPQLRLAPLLTAALAAFAAQNLAMAQSNSWVTESAIGAVPLDLEVTPNGKIAAVRANIPGNNGTSNQKLSFWRTDTGAQIGPAAVGSGNLPWVSASGKPLFSDAVAVTNDAAIAIGSAAIGAASENTTYVDILALTYPGGTPTVSVTQTHVLGGGTGAVTMAGEAHDVAITPDGALAVVSHRNWIHVFDMTSGDLMSEFNIGNLGVPGFPDSCSPGQSRNSVAVTNTRAIVTASRTSPTSPFPLHTWVYIISLESSSDPFILLEHELDPQGIPGDQSPHDLAITPDGQLAVVTANRTVGLYSLGATPSYVGGYTNVLDLRAWSQVPSLWDSVDVSNTHAVVLADRDFSGGYRWSVTVFSISSGGLSSGGTLGGGLGAGGAWDVALSSDGVAAAIKTYFHDVALTNVPGSGIGSAFIAGSGYSTTAYSGGYFGNDNAAVMAPVWEDPNQPKRWAVFMGLDLTGPVNMRFYDLNLSDPGSTAYTLPLADGSPLLKPADIELAPNGVEVMARLSASDSDSGLSNGKDWSRFAGTTPAEVTPSLGAKGIYAGADSLRTRRGTSVSISWDFNNPNPAGFIHFVTVQ